MIVQIDVDGFRSLSNFSLRIRPGLNILVGPNGSGKTNIIAFFEFLANLINHGLADAVSRAGGAASVFAKSGENEFREDLKVTVWGVTTIPEYEKFKEQRVIYKYIFNIKISEDRDILYFSDQELYIARQSQVISYPDDKYRVKKWGFSCSINNVSEDDPGKIHHFIDARSLKLYDLRDRTLTSERRYLLSHSLRYRSDRETTVLRTLDTYFAEMEFLLSDFRGGETLNVVPSLVKLPEDSAKVPGIQKNGTGLAATLYRMKSVRHPGFPRRSLLARRRSAMEIATYNNIINLAMTANDSITSIDVVNSPFDNRLQILCTIGEGEASCTLPLAAMSDGTVKWFTLVAAIHSATSIFAIEEPENFLHPHMQNEIVTLMRNHSESTGDSSFFIMSTHSETLLNAAEPQELVIVSMENGVTQAYRVRNAEEVVREINSTGFGLGYYYLAGVLSHV